MKVTLKEIRKLQEDVSDQVEILNGQPDADVDKLAGLRTMAFNLSMIFLRYSMEKDSTEIEIGGNESEDAIVAALQSHHVKTVHRQVGNTNSATAVENLANMANDLMKQIEVITSGITLGRNAVLMNNINRKFNFAYEILSEVADLTEDVDKLNLWKKEEISNAGSAASMMGRTKSEKKSAAARENGKKGGRPRKYPLPEETKVVDKKQKRTAAKSTASTKKVSRTTRKTGNLKKEA